MIRKLATYLLLFVITFSVGILQFGYHLCNEDGLHLFDHNCITKHENKNISNNKNPKKASNCCANLEKESINKQQYSKTPSQSDLLFSDDCCIKEFFFFVNPLPEKIQKCNLPVPNLSQGSLCGGLVNNLAFLNSQQCFKCTFRIEKIPIKIHTSIENCSLLRTWII
jgi:hypothetical protein